MLKISSLQNPKIKELALLRESKARRQTQRFLIEGAREIERSLASNYRCESMLFCPELLSAQASKLLATIDIDSHIEISSAVFAKLAVREGSDGILALMEARRWSLKSLSFSAPPLLLVLDSIEKPGNYGALARSADGVGADAIVILDEQADLFNPHAIRASVGALFARPLVTCSHEEFVNYCRERDIKIVTASPFAERFHFEEDFRGAVAMVLGSEAQGLSSAWNHLQHTPVKIPMQGIADSLNVSVAGAIILYESLRQRLAKN